MVRACSCTSSHLVISFPAQRPTPGQRCHIATICDRLQPCIPGSGFVLLPALPGPSWIHIPALLPSNPVALEPQTSHLSDGVIA